MKKAIITGGNKGFGLAYSNILKKDGYEVINVSLSDKVNGIDLSTVKGTNELIKLISNERPSLVILNAGYGRTTEFGSYSNEEILKMQHINGTGKAMVLNHFFDDIKNFSMRFIVASSIAGKLPSPLMCSYSASKAYISNLIDSINAELFSSGVKNLIVDATPGNVNTKSQTEEVEEYVQKVLSSTGGQVFNKDLYIDVIQKQFNDWEGFVKNSYDKKMERINAKKL